jgi:hypothetical protein
LTQSDGPTDSSPIRKTREDYPGIMFLFEGVESRRLISQFPGEWSKLLGPAEIFRSLNFKKAHERRKGVLLIFGTEFEDRLTFEIRRSNQKSVSSRNGGFFRQILLPSMRKKKWTNEINFQESIGEGN